MIHYNELPDVIIIMSELIIIIIIVDLDVFLYVV